MSFAAVDRSLYQLPCHRFSSFDLVLKDCYSCDYQNRYVVGYSIHHDKISCRHLISGRNVLKMAQLALMNWKEALAFGSQFLLPDGSLPTDLWENCRGLRKPCSNSDPANDDEEDDEDEDEDEEAISAVASDDNVEMPLDFSPMAGLDLNFFLICSR